MLPAWTLIIPVVVGGFAGWQFHKLFGRKIKYPDRVKQLLANIEKLNKDIEEYKQDLNESLNALTNEVSLKQKAETELTQIKETIKSELQAMKPNIADIEIYFDSENIKPNNPTFLVNYFSGAVPNVGRKEKMEKILNYQEVKGAVNTIISIMQNF